jgi:16S rRNA C967 or C1407 C5-methylase (RsmB/RsmF family)
MRQCTVFRGNTLDQDFNLAASRFVAKQPGGNDPGIIEHKHIIGLYQRREIDELPVFNAGLFSVEVEQATVSALLCRVLGNQLWG